MKKKKLLIMVLSGSEPLYQNLMNGQLKTWDSEKIEDVRTVYYYANPLLKEPCWKIPDVLRSAGTSDNNTELILPCSDEYQMMHWKFKLALDFVMDWEWDFIFRTNSSTYVRKDRILNFIQDKPTEKYYAGVDGGDYASGTGMLMSRDCADFLRKEFTDGINPSEDGLVGCLLKRMGVYLQEGPVRLNYNFAEYKILDADYYRCKSEVMFDGKLDRSYDLKAFYSLYSYFL